MSESAGKTFRGLQEAYASMYSNNSDNLTEETIVSEVQEEQEFEINEELLYESLKKYLISEGFVKTEKQAENAIPHMSEEWVKDIVESILTISEDFDYYINSLIEEGYDLSSYTEEDLFETYINETHNVLSEQLAGDMPGLGWLRGLTGIFGAGAASRAVQTKPRPYRTRPEGSAVDYGQMTLEKPKPTPVVKTQVSGDIEPAKPAKPRVRVTATRPEGSTETQAKPAEQPKTEAPKVEQPKTEAPKVTQGQGTPTPQPEPPKEPKDGILDKLGRFAKEWQKQGAERAAEKASRQAARQQAANRPPSGRTQALVKTLQHPFTKGASATFAGSSLIGDLATGGTGTKKALGVPAGLVGGALYQGGRATQAIGLGPGVKTAGEKILKWSGWSNGKKEQKPAPTPAKPSQRNPYGL